MVRLEGLGQLKNPMTSSGIESATFRLVAECHNQLRYCVPPHDDSAANHDGPEDSRDRTRKIHRCYEGCPRSRHGKMEACFAMGPAHLAHIDMPGPSGFKFVSVLN
jgi:hypothetical protein